MSISQRLRAYNFPLLIIILQLALYSAVYFNISIARLFITILYLMFIPGFVILKFLKIKKLDLAEKVLISVGLSLTFLMLIGLLINELGKIVTLNILSFNFLLSSINITTLLLSLIVAKSEKPNSLRLPQLNRSEKLFVSILIIALLPLGVLGTLAMIVFRNSSLLLLLIAVAAIAISYLFIRDKVSTNLYPATLLIISVFMLFFATGTLIIVHIGGTGDGPIEFYAFKLTELRGLWDSSLTSSPYSWNLFPTYSMLSVTILPIIFSVIAGVDGSLIFKLLYPLIIAFLPLAVYKLYKTQIEPKSALLAAFFFFTVSFGKGWGSYKQQIAQLFYIMLFLLMFKKDISQSKKLILFSIFSVGLVISHYALTYIFLFSITSAFVALAIAERVKGGHLLLRQKIPINMLLIFLTITFSWYVFVNASSTFNLIGQEVNTVISNLGQFFSIESRGTVLQGLGFVETPTFLHSISSALFITTEFLIAMGFLKLLANKDHYSKFSVEYRIFAILNMVIIAINILIPRLADTLLMSRFYQTTLIILSPLAVLGGQAIIEFIFRANIRRIGVSIMAISIFVPLFLFQTGFVYEVAQVKNYSLALSMHRWDDATLYNSIVDFQEVASAQWLSKRSNLSNVIIYSDDISRFGVLTAYGMLERGRIYLLTNSTILSSNEFIYLANVDLISNGYLFNVTEITPVIANQNKLYSNGKSEIYRG